MISLASRSQVLCGIFLYVVDWVTEEVGTMIYRERTSFSVVKFWCLKLAWRANRRENVKTVNTYFTYMNEVKSFVETRVYHLSNAKKSICDFRFFSILFLQRHFKRISIHRRCDAHWWNSRIDRRKHLIIWRDEKKIDYSFGKNFLMQIIYLYFPLPYLGTFVSVREYALFFSRSCTISYLTGR